MFTSASKNFGVWKESRKTNELSFNLFHFQFLFALFISFFIVFVLFIITVKVRQEFFLVESSSQFLYKNDSISNSFLFPERKTSVSLFLKKDPIKGLYIHFDKGESFLLKTQLEELNSYLNHRQKTLISIAMMIRMNHAFNSRAKILTEKNIDFSEIQTTINILSHYGFNDFDIGVER